VAEFGPDVMARTVCPYLDHEVLVVAVASRTEARKVVGVSDSHTLQEVIKLTDSGDEGQVDAAEKKKRNHNANLRCNVS